MVAVARRKEAPLNQIAKDFGISESSAERGIDASENRVQRLCSAHGIWSVLVRKRGRRPRQGNRCTTISSAERSGR